MASPVYADPQSLNILTETLNQTFIETGRFFRSGGGGASKTQLKRSLPRAQEQFQSALDELSEHIFIAKAFLERDYAALQAKKAALKPAEDVVMGESDIKQEPETQPQPELPTNTSQPASKPAEEAVGANPLQVNGESTVPQQEVKAEQMEDTSNPGNQPLSGTGELNFNQAPNDASAPNEFDLNLDFGEDNIGNENFLSGSNFGNIDQSGHNEQEKSNDTPTNIASNAHGDTGQDTNVQAGGDAFDLELQKAGVFTEQQPEGQSTNNNSNNNGNNGNNEDAMALGQSSFDELFMESENFGGEGMGDPNLLEGDGLMNINELDDSWFT
ncbi:hypothetical protein HFD88_006531 [Aspergillus terreus]|nr:hypothetical protein HFD88_006531 [Aspergillus terreus]